MLDGSYILKVRSTVTSSICPADIGSCASDKAVRGDVLKAVCVVFLSNISLCLSNKVVKFVCTPMHATECNVFCSFENLVVLV